MQDAFPGKSLSETRKVLALDVVPDTDDVVCSTPILLEHCVDDPLVLVGNGRNLRDTLRGFSAQVTWKEYPKGGHWFNSPAGIDDVVEFLNCQVLKNSSIRRNLSSPDSMDLS
jgi:acetyl esterase/lipase